MTKRTGGPYVDDRGALVPWRKPAEIVSRLEVRQSTWRRVGGVAFTCTLFGGALAWIIYDVSRNGWPAPSRVLPGAVALAMFFAASWAWYLAQRHVPMLRRKDAPSLPRAQATTLGWGHCCACGERIRELAPEPDGCVTCPTCAAAWHADRWSRGKLLERDVHQALYEIDEYANDARGVTLRPGVFSRERWITPSPLEDTSPQVVPSRRERRVAARREMDRVRERWLLGTAIGVITSILAFAGIAQSIRHLVPFEVMPFAMLGAMAVGTVGLPFARGRACRAYARAALKQGLCPNCGMVLSDHARVEFDGCVSCEHCGRAWKAADVKQPTPATPTAPSSPPRVPWLDAAIAREGRGHD